jgi:hypothetical protein
MKIYLDRRACNCWIAACESCFSSNYLRDDLRPNCCMLEMQEDANPVRTFYVQDRDGILKTLVIDQDNWADYYDSWQLSYEKQAA